VESIHLQVQGTRKDEWVCSPATLGSADPRGRVSIPALLASKPTRWVQTRLPRSILNALGFKGPCILIGKPSRENNEKQLMIIIIIIYMINIIIYILNIIIFIVIKSINVKDRRKLKKHIYYCINFGQTSFILLFVF